MLTLSSDLQFHLYTAPTDMRKGFNGLSSLVNTNLSSDPTNGSVYIFINKPRNKIKLLHWQSGGFVLYYKRLERGTFELPNYDNLVGSLEVNYSQMVMILDGLSIKNIRKRKRFHLDKKQQ